VSLIERDELESVSIGAIQRVTDALDARLVVDIQWAGAELDRLLDAGHSTLAEWLAAMLHRRAWDTRAEVSFNHYGDRGRYDLLAFHPATRILLVVEVKTAIGDLQELLGRLDVKARLARRVGLTFGWQASRVLPLLVVADHSTNRRRVRSHPTLLGRFELRGAEASAWLRRPGEGPGPAGLLLFRKLSNANHSGLNRVRRVRKHHTQTTTASGASGADVTR
jgi:hypothetical protein